MKYSTVDLRGDTYLNPAWPENNRPVGWITRFAIHHDAVDRPHDYDSAARYRNEAATHYQRLGPGLQYHEKIDNTGVRFLIRPFGVFLYHAGDYYWNQHTYAICLDGNFENQQPTREQLESLQERLIELSTQHPEFPAAQGDVYPHRTYTATACPGANLTGYVDQFRATGSISIPANIVYDWPELQPNQPPTPEPVPVPMPPTIEVNYRVYKDGKQIGAYKVDANAWAKYKAGGDQIKDAAGTDVTEALRAKFEPVVTPPVEPVEPPHPEPAPVPEPTPSQPNPLVALIQALIDLIKRIFNRG